MNLQDPKADHQIGIVDTVGLGPHGTEIEKEDVIGTETGNLDQGQGRGEEGSLKLLH